MWKKEGKTKLDRRFLEAVATLIGTTIGAGVLGIPYVVARSGLLVGLLHIIIIGVAVMFVNLLLGEVVLRTKGNHQLTGYAEKYLGNMGKRVMAMIMVVGIYGALIAYIIGIGNAVNAILPQLTPFTGSLVFLVITTCIINFGLKAVEESELLMASIVVIIIFIISLIAMTSGKFSASNFTGISAQNAFLPYGVVLFAFLGAVAIPEMKEGLGHKRKQLRKAIIVGGLVPIVLYSLFAVAVVGISGSSTSEIATIHLGRELGEFMVIGANLFAIFAMSTSFISLGLALKEMYSYDYGLKLRDAWSFTCGIPLVAFLFGVNSFIGLLSMIGAVVGGIEGLLLIAMHWAARRVRGLKPEYSIKITGFLSALLALMFLSGIAYVIFTKVLI